MVSALDDASTMLVCKREEMQPLAQIAAGSFHACLLDQNDNVLVWGMGGLGRLGLGNELDQLVPTVLEIEDEDEEDGEK